LKITGQILMQFYAVMYLTWFYKPIFDPDNYFIKFEFVAKTAGSA